MFHKSIFQISKILFNSQPGNFQNLVESGLGCNLCSSVTGSSQPTINPLNDERLKCFLIDIIFEAELRLLIAANVVLQWEFNTFYSQWNKVSNKTFFC